MMNEIMFALLTLIMPLTLKSSYKEMMEIISKYNKYFSEKAVIGDVENRIAPFIGIFFIIVVFLLWLAFLFGLKISYHIPFVAYLLTHSYFAGVCLLVCELASASKGYKYEENQEDSQVEIEKAPQEND